jgi:type 1 fimbria pilin
MYKLYFSCFFIISVFFSSNIYAKLLLTQADFTIIGSVTIPTCSINGVSSGGLSQTIDMGFYTAKDIVTGNTKEIDIPLIINCSNYLGLNGVALSLSQLGAYGPVGYSQLGAIKTNLKGVSLSLIWKDDNTPVDLTEGVEKILENKNNNIIDGSIKAKLLLMPSFSLTKIGKGFLRSGVNVALRYY